MRLKSNVNALLTLKIKNDHFWKTSAYCDFTFDVQGIFASVFSLLFDQFLMYVFAFYRKTVTYPPS